MIWEWKSQRLALHQQKRGNSNFEGFYFCFLALK